MFIMFMFVVALIVLDVAAVRWGTDSREGLTSREWEYRRLQAKM
jgi:hypothetical protein